MTGGWQGREALRTLALIKSAVRQFQHAGRVRRKCARLDNVRLNIGCGARPTPGWVNFDMFASAQVDLWDCRQGLPFADATIQAIYSEHVFEHLELEDEARPFLAECLRCLKPGGVLRLVVPDAGAYLIAYARPWEDLVRMRALAPTEGGWRDPWLGEVYETPMQLINAVFRQGREHRYAYDEETLALVLRQAGFRDVKVQSYGVSADPAMAPDTESRRSESLYMEAIR